MASTYGPYNPKAHAVEPLENVIVSARQENSALVVRDTINRRANSKGVTGKNSSNLGSVVNRARNNTGMFVNIGEKADAAKMVENVNANYIKTSDEMLANLQSKNMSQSSNSNFKELIHNANNQGAKVIFTSNSNADRQNSNKAKK